MSLLLRVISKGDLLCYIRLRDLLRRICHDLGLWLMERVLRLSFRVEKAV